MSQIIAEEKVVLVDENDHQLGLMGKQQAHEEGVLHRAFSVFVFNTKGKLMLQQRAFHKYHTPGLWTNTCCSHPRDGETYSQAAHRRLQEEMGFVCELSEAFHFIYKADVGQGLTEHELDRVFFGLTDIQAHINPDEVADWKYMGMQELEQDMKSEPGKYTPWFRISFDEVKRHLNEKNLIT